MAEELLINVIPGEIRAAALRDGRLMELFIERRHRASLVGNIYLGRVERVIPGMNAAFVNIGLDRAGFLSADAARASWGNGAGGGTGDTPPISTLVTEGEAVAVQVTKDAIGGKGVQLNRRITLPGRILVYSPLQERVSISRMITDGAEQARLLELMSGIAEPGEGFILRTNAVGAEGDELAADAEFLRMLWSDIEAGRDQAKAPARVHADLDPLPRLFRDHVHDGISRIRIDNDAGLAEAQRFCGRFMPKVVPSLGLHREPEPIFALHDVETEIERALGPRLDLPSGGGIVIESTEALTAIDVNSGSFTGAASQSETAWHTNLEAAAEIARQIRLRNIAGLIVADFIHMDDDGRWDELVAELERGFADDRSLSRVIGVTAGGLIEITRRRRRESLAQLVTESCMHCRGIGRVRSVSSISLEVMRALQREAASAPPGPMTVCAAEDVIDALENGAAESLAALRATVGRHIALRRENGYGREQFDIVVE